MESKYVREMAFQEAQVREKCNSGRKKGCHLVWSQSERIVFYGHPHPRSKYQMNLSLGLKKGKIATPVNLILERGYSGGTLIRFKYLIITKKFGVKELWLSRGSELDKKSMPFSGTFIRIHKGNQAKL